MNISKIKYQEIKTKSLCNEENFTIEKNLFTEHMCRKFFLGNGLFFNEEDISIEKVSKIHIIFL